MVSAADSSSLFSHFRNRSLAKESSSFLPQSTRTRGEKVEKDDHSIDSKQIESERRWPSSQVLGSKEEISIRETKNSKALKFKELEKQIVIDLSLHGAKPSSTIKVRFKGTEEEFELKDRLKLKLKTIPDEKDVT